MDLLTELGLKYNTDKATHHKFTESYDNTFNSIRHDVKNILEIGIYKGESIAMWLEYFPNAVITCIDINDYTNMFKDNPRVKFIRCPQSDFKTTDIFDIIIDDGSHRMDDQQNTFINLINNWSRYYIVEDLHTSLKSYSDPNYGLTNNNSTIDWLVNKLPVWEMNIEFIFANKGNSISSIVKRPKD